MSQRILLEPHAHTKEVSRCGWLSACEVIDQLAHHKYGAVVITDHFLPGEQDSREKRTAFVQGYQQAKAAGEAKGIIVMPGLEIRFKDRLEDYLVYGIEEEEILDLPDDACSMGLQLFHELASSKGWVVYQAHPFRAKLLPANPSFIDGMEIFNGNPRHNSQNRLAAGFATRHNLSTIAGSDIHRQGDAGVVGLLVPAEALTPKDFAKWLKATPHPRIHYQESPVDGIRYTAGAVPNDAMVAALYADAGWKMSKQALDMAMRGIESSSRMLAAWDDTALIGMARAVSDSHTVVFIVDMIVSGPYRRRGIGRGLMRRLLSAYPNVQQVIVCAGDSIENRQFFQACGFQPLQSLHETTYIRALS